MNKKIFGYMLGADFLIVLEKSVLIPMNNKKATPIHLRQTMFRLLVYLIENSSTEPILDDNIMRDVWEKNGLRSSKARLWQVMNAMSKKLCLKDTYSEIFRRVENTGYIVNKSCIRVIYTNDKHPDPGGTYATKWPMQGYSNYRG